MKILLAIDRLLIVVFLMILLSRSEEEVKSFSVNGSITISLSGTDSLDVYFADF